PDSKLIALADARENHSATRIEVRDVATGRVVRAIHEPSVYEPRLYFTPDSRGLAVVGDEVRLWDLRAGRLCRQWFDGSRNLPVAFSPDGKRIALGPHGLAVFDVASGALLRSLHGQRDRLTAVAFSPDGKLLATGCEDGSVVLREAS